MRKKPYDRDEMVRTVAVQLAEVLLDVSRAATPGEIDELMRHVRDWRGALDKRIKRDEVWRKAHPPHPDDIPF